MLDSLGSSGAILSTTSKLSKIPVDARSNHGRNTATVDPSFAMGMTGSPRGMMMPRTLATVCLLFCVAAEARAQARTATPQPFPTCTRADLQATVDSYIAAQKAGDVAKMAFAENVSFLENMSAVDKAKGLWNTGLPIASSRSFLDATRCKTFTEIIVTEGDHPYVIGTRLYVDRGKVTRIDSLVTDKGDWLFNAHAYLKYSKAEDWTAPPQPGTVSAQELINAANSYLDLFSDKFVQVPWGRPCARLEGGAYSNREQRSERHLRGGDSAGRALHRESRLRRRHGDRASSTCSAGSAAAHGHAGLAHLPARERQDHQRSHAEREPESQFPLTAGR